MTIRINFIVHSIGKWPEFFHNPSNITIHDILKHNVMISRGREGWITRTYWELTRRNLPNGAEVRASSRLCKDSINVLHSDSLVRILGKTMPDHFIVCSRSDKELPYAAHFWIEQNGLRKPTPKRGNLPYWRDPELIPRDAGRGTRIERIVFKGSIDNLAPAFRSDAFRAQLAGMGVDLSLGLVQSGSCDDSWGNYRNADLVLAVRKMTSAMARTKPASKMINAWAAGVPALLGPEPALRELRKSDLDYIEVHSTEEILAAITRLRNDPELYAAMVANGLERAKEFTDDMIAEQWATLLDGPVTRAWEQWKQRSKLRRVGEHLVGLPAHLASWFLWRAGGRVARWLAF